MGDLRIRAFVNIELVIPDSLESTPEEELI